MELMVIPGFRRNASNPDDPLHLAVHSYRPATTGGNPGCAFAVSAPAPVSGGMFSRAT